MILGPSWITYGGSVGLALLIGAGGGVVKGHELGERSVQAKWDAQAVKDRQAIDDANVNAQAAAELYEEKKATKQVVVVTKIREVSHAIEAAPSWSLQPVPDGVRDSIAAASAALDSAQPDGSVRVPAAGDPEQRAVGDGVHPGPRSALRLLDAASSPR